MGDLSFSLCKGIMFLVLVKSAPIFATNTTGLLL